MSIGFGDVRTIPASKPAKNIMKQLENKKIFDKQLDVWRLGAALGIAHNKVHDGEKRDTFQNINSLDTEQVFAAIMLGLYPNMTPEDRVKKLVDHAEWGIRELSRKVKIDTLDFSTLGVPEEDSMISVDKEKTKEMNLEDVIKKGESISLEFKSSLRWDMINDKLLDELSNVCLKTIVGFSNSKDGGTLIIGVDPDGTVIGLEKDYTVLKPSNKDGFEQYIMSKVSDNIGNECATDISIEFPVCNDKEICKVNVPPGLQPAYLKEKGKLTFYVRVGNSTKPLNVEDATKYCIRRFKF